MARTTDRKSSRISPSHLQGIPERTKLLAGWAAALSGLLVCTAHGQVTPLGPTPYLSFADSPFNGTSFSWFALLTGEPDHVSYTGIRLINAGGAEVLTTGPGGITDSVDGDDGTIDGSGSNGRSYFTCPSFVDIRFDAALLGSLPTHAGVVWTDGMGTVTVRSYGSDGELLGTITGTSSDGNYNSGTAEDRFYGFIAPAGISRLTIGDENNCIEVDHIQAGFAGGCRGCSLADLGIGRACPDGIVDGADFIAFINSFSTGDVAIDPLADVNHDGIIDGSDFILFINAFSAGC